MKKIIAVVLSMVLIVLIMPINTLAAGTIISLSNQQVVVNNNLSVIITIVADESMFGVGFVVSYDSSKFEYISGASAGGDGMLQIIESPSGVTKATYVLQFRALSEGNATFSLRDCRYESLTESKSLPGASVSVDVISNPDIAEGICGDNALWKLSEDGILVISGTGSTTDYKLPMLAPWYEYRERINSVIIEKEITRIGNNNFSGIANLKYAKIYNPNMLFGVYAFATGASLTIECERDSSVEKYAIECGYSVLIIGALEAPIIESIEKTTATLKAVDGFEYSMDGIKWQASNIFTDIPMDEILYFYQRTSGSDINEALPISNAAKGISISAPKVLVGSSKIWVKPIKGYEYGLEDLIWQESNIFDEYIVNGELYTVYHRPINQDDIFVAYEGIKVTVNGDNEITEPKAMDLVWLRNLILNNKTINNLAADFNRDGEIDARDIVSMKKEIADINN